MVEGFGELWRSLEAGFKQPVLVVGDGGDSLLERLAASRGTRPLSVSRFLTVDESRCLRDPEKALRGHHFLTDLEILFWPDVLVDPLRLFRILSRHHPVIARWPGDVGNARAVFSEPGRPDYYDEPLANEFLLSSRPIASPSDHSYVLEIAR